MARTAGARALAAYRAVPTLEFKGKKQDDPVTAADRDVETFLRSEIHRRFPDHGIVGEEHDDVEPGARYVWVLDPLDGTANFASHLPLWCVSIAVLDRGIPVVGCLWAPVGPDLAAGVYHARRGGGAWFDQQPIAAASGEDERGRAIALPGQYWRTFRFRRPPKGTPRSRRLADSRSLGSITAELALVAAGSLRLAIFVQPKIWDVAAGALLVAEAGGRVLIWRDRRWQPLDRYEPMPPSKGTAPPTLRTWSRPVLVGAPALADRAAASLAWHPRLPGPLRRLLGLEG